MGATGKGAADGRRLARLPRPVHVSNRRGGGRDGRALQRRVFQAVALSGDKVADGRLETDKLVLRGVEMLQGAQVRDGRRQYRKLVAAQVELLKLHELADGGVQLAQAVAVQRERLYVT